MSEQTTKKAWASVALLKKRSSTFAALTLGALALGLLLMFIGIGSATSSYSSEGAVSGTVAATLGTVILSASGFFLVAWIFSASMADHAAVVFFASGNDHSSVFAPANAGATLPGTAQSTTDIRVNEAGKYWRSSCGAINDLDELTCRNCGETLA